jgi:hypothetical protein
MLIINLKVLYLHVLMQLLRNLQHQQEDRMPTLFLRIQKQLLMAIKKYGVMESQSLTQESATYGHLIDISQNKKAVLVPGLNLS